MVLEDLLLSILKSNPSDQYSLFRLVGNAKMSDISKALAHLKQSHLIHVAGYRKNSRTGLDVPIYSLRPAKTATLDVHPLLAGVTSERLVEYDFVARNLPPRTRKAMMLDIGTGRSGLAKTVREFGKARWQVFGIDWSELHCDARMDARFMAFCDELFDQIICISTIEHVGISGAGDRNGDGKVMGEINRILKRNGTVILSMPYGRQKKIKREHRIYDRHALANLVEPLVIDKKEFYLFSSGKWVKRSQATADKTENTTGVPAGFHSAACACLLLRKIA